MAFSSLTRPMNACRLDPQDYPRNSLCIPRGFVRSRAATVAFSSWTSEFRRTTSLAPDSQCPVHHSLDFQRLSFAYHVDGGLFGLRLGRSVLCAHHWAISSEEVLASRENLFKSTFSMPTTIYRVKHVTDQIRISSGSIFLC
jgi:hypothetical protein